MSRPISLVAAFLAYSALLPATTLVLSFENREVPRIPHGQDWSLLLPSEPVGPPNPMSFEEAWRVLPHVPALVHLPKILHPRTSLHKDASPSLLTMAKIAVAVALLLAGYDMIPRVHANTLRFRALYLKQDLFT